MEGEPVTGNVTTGGMENNIPDLDVQILALQKQKEDREKRQREMEERKAIQTVQIHSPGVTGEPIHNVLTEIKDDLWTRQHLGTLLEREIHNTSYMYKTVKQLKDIVNDHSMAVYMDIKPGVEPKGKHVTSRSMVTTGDLTLSREAGGDDSNADVDHPMKYSNIRIEVQFSKALPATINVILYCKCDNAISFVGNAQAGFRSMKRGNAVD